MVFKPGQSGNPGGRTRAKILSDDLRKLAVQNPARIRTISEHIMSQAEAGDLDYITFLYDRLEGRPAQSMDINQNLNILPASERLAALLRRQGTVVDLEPLAIEGPSD